MKLLERYRQMVRLRVFEEQVKKIYMAGLMAGIADLKLNIIGARDAPIPFSPPLVNFVIPQEEDIEKMVRAMV